MLLLLNILVVVFLSLHFAFTTIVIKGLMKKVTEINENHNYSVSVLIAARNEQANIEYVLDSISENTFNKSSYEVIVIDDHSEDQTIEIVKKWSTDHHTMKLVLVSAKGTGKKNAIEEGLKICTNEIILQTDADCFVPEKWIESMTTHFKRSEVQMVAGPVQLYPTTNFFERLQGLEFSSLIASSIGLSRKGWSIMANAANLAYRKSSREQFFFNEKSESGDDVFFIQQLAKKSPKSIVYLSDSSSLVTTKPSSSICGFLNQRARWASKTKEYPNFKGKLIATYVLLLNVLTLVVFANLLSVSHNWVVSVVFLVTRFILDFSILKLYYMQTLKKQLNPLSVFFLSIIYPFYILSVMVLILFGKTKWKGRRL